MNAGFPFYKAGNRIAYILQRSVGRLCIVLSNQKAHPYAWSWGGKNDAIFVKMA